MHILHQNFLKRPLRHLSLGQGDFITVGVNHPVRQDMLHLPGYRTDGLHFASSKQPDVSGKPGHLLLCHFLAGLHQREFIQVVPNVAGSALMKKGIRARTDIKINDSESGLINEITTLEALSPLKVLARGYSYTENMSGKVISSVEDVSVNDGILVTLKDGRITARVEDKVMD